MGYIITYIIIQYIFLEVEVQVLTLIVLVIVLMQLTLVGIIGLDILTGFIMESLIVEFRIVVVPKMELILLMEKLVEMLL